jgi:hypothetical protein
MNFFEKLGQVAANNLVKQAAEDKKKKKSKPSAAAKIVDTGSFKGQLADYLAPGMWGGERAGRSQAMASAIEEPTTFGVRHPVTSSILHTLGGAGLGALGGAGLGGVAGYSPDSRSDNSATGAIMGALAGGLLGGAGGVYSAGKSRRDEMKRINALYDEDEAAGKVNPKNPNFSLLSALLMPGRASHRTGQLEAVKAMKGSGDIADQRGGARDLLYGAQLATMPVTGPLVNLLHNYGQNARTQLEDPDGTPDMKPVRRNRPAA